MTSLARWLWLAALLASACQKSADPNDGKRMPKPPPPAHAALPASLHIEVVADGKPQPPIDAARLNATRADFSDEERRAWKISTLLGPAADRAGTTLAVTGEKGLTISLHPGADRAIIPVLTVTRRGEVVVAMVPADQPFPPYHGQGGRLRRPGDPLPRIADVTQIKVEGGGP